MNTDKRVECSRIHKNCVWWSLSVFVGSASVSARCVVSRRVCVSQLMAAHHNFGFAFDAPKAEL